MAVLWQYQNGTTRYEVRSAGASRRLYTDGVFHSQFNPRQPVSGGVWDLLFLPAFFKPSGSVRRVLVLGVGGGAVIRQIQYFLQPEQIVGIELDPIHLRIARQYFGVKGKNVRLVCADAVTWLRHYQGAPFDLVVDDLFSAAEGEPVRAVAADGDWFRLLKGVLAPRGVLTMNFPSIYDIRRCGYVCSPQVKRFFASAYRFTLPLYENAIGAFLRSSSTRRTLHRHLAACRELDLRNQSCRLPFDAKSFGA